MQILEVHNLEAGYQGKQVIFGVSLNVKAKEIVALIGPNGAGKSTILKAICGLIPAWNGDIWFEGTRINDSSTPDNVAQGITFAPQGNRVFEELSVKDNLIMGGYQLSKDDRDDRIDLVLEFFPVLNERLHVLAGCLSGGEQQMLAFARALIPRPKLLMLDEPSLGLSPQFVSRTFQKITEINQKTGVAILIIEQKVRDVLAISNRMYGLKLGQVELESDLVDNIANEQLRDLFL